MKVSVELLYHFLCDRCQKWWSAGDYDWVEGKTIYCPHCQQDHQLPEKPLTGKDFLDQARPNHMPPLEGGSLMRF